LSLFLFLSVTGARAEEAAKITDTMDASAGGAITKGVHFSVLAQTGGPDGKAIADLFRESLEDAGCKLRRGVGYELRFRVSGIRPHGRSSSALKLSGDGSSGASNNVDLKMRWKADRDQAGGQRRGRYLSVSVTDGNRNEVWRARIDMQSGSGDDFDLANAFMPALIADLARTVFALRVT